MFFKFNTRGHLYSRDRPVSQGRDTNSPPNYRENKRRRKTDARRNTRNRVYNSCPILNVGKRNRKFATRKKQAALTRSTFLRDGIVFRAIRRADDVFKNVPRCSLVGTRVQFTRILLSTSATGGYRSPVFRSTNRKIVVKNRSGGYTRSNIIELVRGTIHRTQELGSDWNRMVRRRCRLPQSRL